MALGPPVVITTPLISYRVNDGPWLPIDGPVEVESGDRVEASFDPIDGPDAPVVHYFVDRVRRGLLSLPREITLSSQ